MFLRSYQDYKGMGGKCQVGQEVTSMLERDKR